MSTSKSFPPACEGEACSVSDLMKGRASRLEPRTVALTTLALLTTSTWKSSPAEMRACVIFAARMEPSTPTSAEPRMRTVPKSTARLPSAAPSGAGLTWKVALPGLPAAFETPGTGLSIAAWVRSISTSALVRLSGALSLIGSGPFSQPRLKPRFARAAWSSVRVRVAEPSSPGALPTSRWAAAPNTWPSPAIFSVFAIGLEGEIPLIELLLADELVERQVGQRAGGVKLGVVGLGGFPELEVENEIPLRLPLDRRRIDLQARLLAQGLAAEQVGERVGGAAQMGPRLRVDDRPRRRIGHGEDDVVALDAPRRRQRHRRMVAGDGEIAAGERPRALPPTPSSAGPGADRRRRRELENVPCTLSRGTARL